MTTNTRSIFLQKGFSLMEVLMIVAVIGILGALSVMVVSNTVHTSKETKLSSDVVTLNSAVLAYLASNGDLSSAKTPADVVAKLKTVASPDSASRFNGYRGGFLDARIEPIMQTGSEAATDSPRVYWDEVKMKFEIANAGPAGIKGFRINEDLASAALITEERKRPLDLAQRDTWIWDYTEEAPTFSSGPSVIPVSLTSSPPASPGVPSLPPSTGVPVTQPLDPPSFSIPPGTYPITDFDLSVALTNPNPAGISQLFYRIDYDAWKNYPGGNLTVPAGAVVDAQAIPVNTSAYDPSLIAKAEYDAAPATLLPPPIDPDNPAFGFFVKNDVIVTLTDPNDPGTALLQYKIDGGSWQDYSTPFLLAYTDFPSGADIEARSISSGSSYYLPSSSTFRNLAVESLNLAGSADGSFHDPTGGDRLVTNLAPGETSSLFQWGNGNGPGRSQSWMEFTGEAFDQITDGLRFNVGSLEYFNGTISNGSGADTIDFDINLTVNINGSVFHPFFDFTFDLINTPNQGNDPEASADFVYLNDTRASRTLVFNGFEFEFQLEFGETTANGFSTVDRFHVFENKGASAAVYGTFRLLGPATNESGGGNGPIKGGVAVAIEEGTGTEGGILYQKVGYEDPEEYVKSLEKLAKTAEDAAKDARDETTDQEKTADDKFQSFLSKISSEKFSDATALIPLIHAAAVEAETQALLAESAAAQANQYAALAQAAAEEDPEAASTANKVNQAGSKTQGYANEARTFANLANTAADQATTIWNDILNNAPTANPEAFTNYLADLAKDQRDIAKNTRDQAEEAAGDANKALKDLKKELDKGNNEKAAEKYALIGPAAVLAESEAVRSEQAALDARAAAAEALAIAENNPSAEDNAADADEFAADAEAYAGEARIAADQAAADASEANSLY